MELMGGVEQINNSETVEISRKERRSSRGVSKSVSRNLDTATRLHVYSSSTSTPVKSTASRKKVSAFGDQFLELMGGVEPPTFSLRMRCSAIKLHQRIALCKYNRARTIIQSVFILCLRASVPPPRLSARVSSLRGQR